MILLEQDHYNSAYDRFKFIKDIHQPCIWLSWRKYLQAIWRPQKKCENENIFWK